MMRFDDMRNVEVEHGFGDVTHKGFVKFRVIGTTTTIVSQFPPEQALEIAQNLIFCAGRATYEEDLWYGLRAAGLDEEVITKFMGLVRYAEVARETGSGPSEDPEPPDGP